MRPVSAAFLTTLSGSHTAAFEARACVPGQTGVDPDGTVLTLPPGANVEMDATADVRATLDCTAVGKGLFPERADGDLNPYGNEIWVRRGVAYNRGSTEWVSLGYYRIESVAQDDAKPDGPVRILAYDRMAGIVDGQLPAPVQFLSSATYGSVVEQLVTDIYPWATIEWDDATDSQTLGRPVIADQDRYGFLNKLLAARGKIWYWDYRGVLVIRDAPDPAGSPVWTIGHGKDGVLVKAGRRISRTGVYNGVVAYGESTDSSDPAWAIAVDNGPNSPTRWGGAFGKVPRYYSSPLLLTNAQASTAAAGLLSRRIGLPYSVDLTAVPNPALEPDDVIQVVYPGRSERHIIDKITIPLDAQTPMTASTREQTLVLIGGA